MMLESYITMIESFVSGKINGDEFEKQYLEAFKNDNELQVGEEFMVLDALFADVDSYCGDPELIDPVDLGEAELRESARAALDKLLKLKNKS